ncbi:hypothetical protein Tco_0616495 [Tanacetum coccineum]
MYPWLLILIIWNSTWQIRGRPSRSSRNSLTTGISSSRLSSGFFSIHGPMKGEGGEGERRPGGRIDGTGLRSGLCGWPFVSVVPGQMTHLVASLTLDSARSCVMQGAFLTQGKASSIPTIFGWGDNISPEGFLPLILLLLVIIVAVVIVVTVILVVVVVGEGSSIIKLLFVIIGSLHRIMLCYLIHLTSGLW